MIMNDTTASDNSVILINYVGSLMSLLEVFENLMVILAIFTFKRLCENFHVYFILFMSLSDTLLGCGLIFMFCTTIVSFGQSVDARICVTVNVIIFIALLTSCGQTLLICLERFMATYSRSTLQLFSSKRRKIYIFMNWLISCILVLILFLVVPPDVKYVSYCNLQIVYNLQNKLVICLTISMYFLILLVFVIGLYAGTAYRISGRLNYIKPTTPVKYSQKQNDF